MQKVFFIVGPTAVGKTDVAVDLAERHGAEIVSADAFQIYRGFDLLTAKPTPEQRRRVTHHLIGHLGLGETYNVARYFDDARVAAERAIQAGRPVIVVGGNGLYVKALTHGLSTLPQAQAGLRAELDRSPLPALVDRLRLLDPAAAAVIDARNPRRVVRALEVCLLTGKPFSSFQTLWQQPLPGHRLRGVFLQRERDDLAARINGRVEAMFNAGVVEEVRAADLETMSPTARQILGFAEIHDLLAGKCDLSTCKERIKVATRQYAKRQVTWFKRETLFEPVRLNNTLGSSVLHEATDAAFRRFHASSLQDV